MNNMPKALRERLGANPLYKQCLRKMVLNDHECQGDPLRPGKLIEWEHCLYWRGKELQEEFAIIPICWWAHRGPGFNKEINVWLALRRATTEELQAISKAENYEQKLNYLNTKYDNSINIIPLERV